MKNLVLIIFLSVYYHSFSQVPLSKPLADAVAYIDNKDHTIARMRYKVTQSKYRDNAAMFIPFNNVLDNFGHEKYTRLAPLVLEKNVLELQESIANNQLTYTDLTLFYLYRMRLYETDSITCLNAIISLNKGVIQEAQALDKKKKKGGIYGIPILLKDNIGFDKLPTTAGAAILQKSIAKDAYITKRLKNAGSLILGKTNLSEWAYYFCQGCPVGYSAVGGQTFNAYARKKIETGGSSSGSGVAGAMNYAALTVGTETSGSILSPSSANALVGLKPTVGYLSRSGIVPISSTLDTPGPMTKNVIDNALLLDALAGFDKNDNRSVKTKSVFKDLTTLDLKSIKVGIFESLLKQNVYKNAVDDLRAYGAEIILIKEEPVNLDGFVKILSIDMKSDLPAYIKENTLLSAQISKVEDIMLYNLENIADKAPYGQQNLENIINEAETAASFEPRKKEIQQAAKTFFGNILKQADVFLSVANMHAQVAAAANHPCLTLPYGVMNNQPLGITLIGPQWSEKKLLQIAYQIEKHGPKRVVPSAYMPKQK